MPYKREKASKGGHSDIIKNPDVMRFLQDCEYMKGLDKKEGDEISQLFEDAPPFKELPKKVIASDASAYSEPISNSFPTTQVGYVKVSFVLIDVESYDGLVSKESRFVDPGKVAYLHKSADAISFPLPGSNIKYKGSLSVAESFRKAVFEHFCSNQSEFVRGGSYNLKGTLQLFDKIHDEPLLIVKKCPECSYDKKCFVFGDELKIKCPSCNNEIFFTDSLRLHEQVSDFGNSSSAITRFMNVTEHLLMATLIRTLFEKQPEILSQMAFVIDGPLAIFGQPARIHARLMKYYYEIEEKLHQIGLEPPLIVGIQKTGSLVEHAMAISKFLRSNTYKIVDDEYRKKFIVGFDSSNENFGHETYYGQDFIYKTPSGKVFVAALPYPFSNKNDRRKFSKEKAKKELYEEKLMKLFHLLSHFEFELYENAIVPVALAHRHASISLIPGGKVLDFLTKNNLNN